MAKILCMIDSFKGSMTSKALGEIAKDTLIQKGHQVSYFPISDGGDGFLDTIEHIFHYKKRTVSVANPNGDIVQASYLYDEQSKSAYIEMAQSSGIHLIDIKETSIFKRSTFGLGELIYDCINQGMKKIYIGLGGSATNDGGAGMLSAIGLKFLNDQNKVIENITPSDFLSIKGIDTSRFIDEYSNIEFILLSDVDNPLLGFRGSSYVFGPQKGLKQNEIPISESFMSHYATKLEEAFKRSKREVKGSGAAGGVGFGLMTACDAVYKSGIDEILSKIELNHTDYDYIITGEGKIDDQSLNGKVIYGIIKKFKGSKIILVCGKNELSKDNLSELGVYAIYDIMGDLKVTLEQSMGEPAKYFKQLMETINIKE